MNAVEVKSLIYICNLRLCDILMYTVICERCGSKEDVVAKIEKVKLGCFGNMNRMNESKVAKRTNQIR